MALFVSLFVPLLYHPSTWVDVGFSSVFAWVFMSSLTYRLGEWQFVYW